MEKEKSNVETLQVGDILLQSTSSNLKELKGIARSMIVDKKISSYLQERKISNKQTSYIS